MSNEQRRTKAIYQVIQKIASEDDRQFRPGDVATELRQSGQPMEVWEIRGEFSILLSQGLITLDKTNGNYKLTSAARKVG